MVKKFWYSRKEVLLIFAIALIVYCDMDLVLVGILIRIPY
jgi:hypothetical protein